MKQEALLSVPPVVKQDAAMPVLPVVKKEARFEELEQESEIGEESEISAAPDNWNDTEVGYKRPDAGKRPITHDDATGSSKQRKCNSVFGCGQCFCDQCYPPGEL